jgi:KIF-1 binding protein C terminal
MYLLGLISGEEVRPFLNAHFMCCRAMSKIILDNSSSGGSSINRNKADYLVASLHRYDWLSKYSIQLCLKKSLDIDTVFGAEVKICNDMVELLPSKIDRMHFHGESGLTI